MTFLGALLPGAGYVWSRRRAGLVILAVSLTAGVLAAVQLRDTRSLLEFAFDPTRLRWAAALVGLGFVLWAFVVVTTYLMVRPARRTTAREVGLGAVVAVVLVAAVPIVQAHPVHHRPGRPGQHRVRRDRADGDRTPGRVAGGSLGRQGPDRDPGARG